MSSVIIGPKVYCNKKEEFKLEEVQELLENVNDALLCTTTCQRPNASEVFVYEYSNAVTKGGEKLDGDDQKVGHQLRNTVESSSQSDVPLTGPEVSATTSPMTAREFAQSLECWMWQQQCWAQQMNWLSWFQYSMPLLATMTTPASLTPPATGEIQQNAVPSQLFHPTVSQPQRVMPGRECRIAPISKRLMAEFIDFMLVFAVKLLISITAMDYGFNLFQVATDADFEQLLSMTWDPNVALAVTTDILVMEVVNRIFICIFETICLWKMGATPGKRIMGLCVVSCEELIPLPSGRVRILPAGNISFFNALLRATIKNFSLAFFFPVCMTVFFFQHNRAMYDIVSGSIAVEQPNVIQGRRRR